MIFSIYIQDQFYKQVDVNNITEAIKVAGNDIASNLVSFYDPSHNQNIKIVPEKSSNKIIWDWRQND